MRRGSSRGSLLGSDGLPIFDGGQGAQRFADKHATEEQKARKAALAKEAAEKAEAEQAAAEMAAAEQAEAEAAAAENVAAAAAAAAAAANARHTVRRQSSGRQQLGSDGLPITAGARPLVPKKQKEPEPGPESRSFFSWGSSDEAPALAPAPAPAPAPAVELQPTTPVQSAPVVQPARKQSPPPQQQQQQEGELEGFEKFCGRELKPRLVAARPRLSKFVDNTVIYVASYMWYILLAHYLLSLHPSPSCSGLEDEEGHLLLSANATARRLLASNSSVDAGVDSAPGTQAFVLGEDDCDSSSAAAQALFALSAIVLGALVVALVCKDAKDRAAAAILPKVIGMMVGWAAGAALKAWMQEISSSFSGGQCTGDLSEWGACASPRQRLQLAGLNLLLVLAATAASALVILAVKPCSDKVELGDSEWHDRLENAIVMTWRLCSRALTVSSAVVWTYVLEGFVLIEARSPTDVTLRLALSGLGFTLLLAWLTSKVQARIDRLTEEVRLLESSRLGVSIDRAGWLWKKARAELYRLVESSSGWLVGCLWTDALFAITREWASSPLFSGLLALALLLLACAWLLATGEDDTLTSSEAREAASITRYFVTNAFSFIVGWACVLVVTDLQPHVVAHDDRPHQIETLGILLLFGPALTYGLIRFQLVTADKYDKMETPASKPLAMV